MESQGKEKKKISKEQKEELKKEKKINQQIEKMLKQDKKRMELEVKLLLLGAGESGKSTIAKQMKILHLDGFTAKERKNYVPIIHNNAISAIQILIEATKTLDIPIDEANKPIAERLEKFRLDIEGELTPETVDDIRVLWQDEGIRKAYERRAEFQIFDSAA